MQQGKGPQDATGWPAVRATLDAYLQTANSIIAECSDIIYTDEIAQSTVKRSGRKVDSGISIKSAESRSSSGSSTKANDIPEQVIKPQLPLCRSGTTLEKIAREFKNMGRSKIDVTEISSSEPVSESKDSSRGIRKLRSIGSLGNLRKANSSTTSVGGTKSRREEPSYDIDEMRRQRMIYEANAAKTSMSPSAVALASGA